MGHEGRDSCIPHLSFTSEQAAVLRVDALTGLLPKGIAAVFTSPYQSSVLVTV